MINLFNILNTGELFPVIDINIINILHILTRLLAIISITITLYKNRDVFNLFISDKLLISFTILLTAIIVWNLSVINITDLLENIIFLAEELSSDDEGFIQDLSDENESEVKEIGSTYGGDPDDPEPEDPVPAVLCPDCLKEGRWTWVMKGKNCPKCGCEC